MTTSHELRPGVLWFGDLDLPTGDWSRVLTNTPLRPATGEPRNTFTGVFLDPPYETSHDVYAEGHNIGADVRAWCIEHGATPYYRIALCGYEGEHNDLEAHGWTCVAWKAAGGYSKDKKRLAP